VLPFLYSSGYLLSAAVTAGFFDLEIPFSPFNPFFNTKCYSLAKRGPGNMARGMKTRGGENNESG
jgi:hypothetical protein